MTRVQPKKQQIAAIPQRFWPWLAVVGGLGAVALAGLGAVAYTSQARTIIRHATVAGQEIGGLDTLTALHRLEERWNVFTSQAFSFSAAGQRFSVPTAGAVSNDNEVVVDIVGLDVLQAVNEAYAFGHQGPWWQQARQRLSAWLGREHRFGTLRFDSASLAEELHRKLVAQEQPPVNAGLTVSGETIAVTPSVTGRSFNYRDAIRQAKDRLARLDPSAITVRQTVVQPDIPNRPGLEGLAAEQVPPLLAMTPLAVAAGDKHWTIDRDQLSALLGWKRQGGTVAAGFDRGKLITWLAKRKPEVEIQAQNAKFSIVNGQVKEFQASAIGRLIDEPTTIAQMENDIIVNKGKVTNLILRELKPITDTTSTNNLGITELVAEGRTNFRGSPPNRRFNLTYGSQKLNGILIAPGETFSLVKALGPIDAAHGWKPELVIKGTDIKPEFGGGLCQVGTTMFRAALNAGLPIVERQNHSLRIRYYEPPIGLDATIYEPKPDLRFINDYSRYLLLQTRIEGDDLIYSFYGTKDGRQVEIPEPRVYNRLPIPPTKTIEVDDLKPGEKQCQAPGHPGADATATYTVTKADGTKVTQVFQSHYRPLPVICRVGKKRPTTKTTTNTNSTTNSTASGQ